MSYIEVEQKSEAGRICLDDISEEYVGPTYDLSDIKVMIHKPIRKGEPISYHFWDEGGIIQSTHPKYSTLEKLFESNSS